MPENYATLVGVFSDSRRLVEAVEAMREGGYKVLEALSPIPLPELDELLPHRPSSVRWFTLLGCMGLLLGGVLAPLGYLFALWAAPSAIAATVVLVTLLLITVCGTLLGSILPLTFRRLGLDPAMMSNPFVAGLIDLLGIVIYMKAALLILR